jgi:aspartate/methionine/tyrosine aminotransferase
LTFAPAYENYFHQANSAGLSLEAITLAEPDFAVNAADLDAAWSDRVRGILICNPCNPTGKVFSRDELQLISEFARRRNLIILSDEAYESFIWKGTHVSIGSLPDAQDRTVSIFSLGKTFSVTGWRVGYAAGPETLLRPISVAHELTTITASHPCQLALAQALELPSSFHAQQHRHYEKRKTLLTEALLDFGITPWDPAGSYFLWCDYSLIADEPDSVFTERLMRVAGVAGVPGYVFLPRSAANPKRIRFTFSKSLATINEASRRLAGARLKLTA